MGKSKNSFLKQWFTFKFSEDNSSELMYSFTNNHYIQGWMEAHGYTEFKNEIKLEDMDKFIFEINEIYDNSEVTFNKYFPEKYIEEYSLWNLEKKDYWYSLDEYKEHVKEEMSKLFDNLWENWDNLENGNVEGTFEYNMYYNH